MPEHANPTEVQAAWVGFAQSMRALLVPIPDDRPLDQYLSLRDTVFRLAERPEFLDDLESAWTRGVARASSAPEGRPPSGSPVLDTRFKEVLLMELRAFPAAAEVAKATERPLKESNGFWGRLLGRGSTTIGSIRDLANLTPYGKGVLTLMKEVVDLFKG